MWHVFTTYDNCSTAYVCEVNQLKPFYVVLTRNLPRPNFLLSLLRLKWLQRPTVNWRVYKYRSRTTKNISEKRFIYTVCGVFAYALCARHHSIILQSWNSQQQIENQKLSSNKKENTSILNCSSLFSWCCYHTLSNSCQCSWQNRIVICAELSRRYTHPYITAHRYDGSQARTCTENSAAHLLNWHQSTAVSVLGSQTK